MDFEVLTFNSVDDWARNRVNYIGSSEAGALWGVSSYASPRSVWEHKVNGIEPEIDADLAEWGHCIEVAVADFYAKKTGFKVWDPGANTVFRSTKWPWMAASLDRVIIGEDLERIPLECKNRGGAGARNWREEGEGAPLSVQLQVMHVLAVTGWKQGLIGVALGGLPPEFTPVKRDEEMIAMHIEKCREMWDRVQRHDPPPVDGHEATLNAIKRRFQPKAGKCIVLPDQDKSLRMHKLLLDSKRAIEGATENKQKAESWLREHLGDAEAGILDGIGTYRIKTVNGSEKRRGYTTLTFQEMK